VCTQEYLRSYSLLSKILIAPDGELILLIKKLFPMDNDYKDLLSNIKQKVNQAQLKTVVAANSQMLFLYWEMGNYIIQNQNHRGWGAKIISLLSADLRKEFPAIKGFSARNMLYMKQFAETFPVPVLQLFVQLEKDIRDKGIIAQQLVAQFQSIEDQHIKLVQQPVALIEESLFMQSVLARLSWSHHVILMDKVPHLGQRFWYMLNTIEHGNSRNVLAMQIESGLFDRQIKAKKITNFFRTLPEPHTDFANYILKDPFIFDFVQAKEKVDERNIEQQLTEHITKFLLELGHGFAFVGKQVHFEVGKTDFYADLLFYHTKLHAYVVVELKARAFEPGDASQPNFYVNLVNDRLKGEEDNDTIGILLCKGKDEVLAEYALRGIMQPIGVTDYQLGKAVPEELKSQLPDIADLENELFQRN
jgi:predicted nuclease of restriction endonuclease-like (RecB) superfamily